MASRLDFGALTVKIQCPAMTHQPLGLTLQANPQLQGLELGSTGSICSKDAGLELEDESTQKV